LELVSVNASFFGAEGFPSSPRTVPAALSRPLGGSDVF
jgi:hypothetical protein